MRRLLGFLRWLLMAQQQSGRNLAYILWDFIYLRRILGKLSKDEYLKFRLYVTSNQLRKTFLPYNQAVEYWKLLNPDIYACLARDKYIAHSILKMNNIPTSELYLYYNPNVVVKSEFQAYDINGVMHILSQKQIKSCVIKPAQDSAHGDGVIVCYDIVFEDNTCYLKKYNGSYISLGDVLRDRPLLFEELIVQNQQFSLFNASSVNTIRIMTALYPSSEVKVIAAFLKIGRCGSDVDIAGGGGNVDCAVDIKSGALYNVVEFNSWRDIRMVTNHPDNATKIDGEIIDGWEHIVAQIKVFQSRIPQLKIIGWDVAITDRGPIIIEFNNWWDSTGQLFIGRGWRHPVVECYNQWSRIR